MSARNTSRSAKKASQAIEEEVDIVPDSPEAPRSVKRRQTEFQSAAVSSSSAAPAPVSKPQPNFASSSSVINGYNVRSAYNRDFVEVFSAGGEGYSGSTFTISMTAELACSEYAAASVAAVAAKAGYEQFGDIPLGLEVVWNSARSANPVTIRLPVWGFLDAATKLTALMDDDKTAGKFRKIIAKVKEGMQ